MGGGRSRTFPKDYDQLDRLKHENQKLKREVARLRKELSKIDVDRHEHLKELVQQQYQEDMEAHKKSTKEELIKKWECFKCNIGYLRLIILNRLDGVFYFRRCTECAHKTRLKKYTEKVEGIKD